MTSLAFITCGSTNYLSVHNNKPLTLLEICDKGKGASHKRDGGHLPLTDRLPDRLAELTIFEGGIHVDGILKNKIINVTVCKLTSLGVPLAIEFI